jgi:hypothetical protein
MAHLEYSIPHASLLAMGVEEKKRNWLKNNIRCLFDYLNSSGIQLLRLEQLWCLGTYTGGCNASSTNLTITERIGNIKYRCVREVSRILTTSMAHLEYFIPHSSLLVVGVKEKNETW